jgi:hypothetical protein
MSWTHKTAINKEFLRVVIIKNKIRVKGVVGH